MNENLTSVVWVEIRCDHRALTNIHLLLYSWWKIYFDICLFSYEHARNILPHPHRNFSNRNKMFYSPKEQNITEN